MNTLRNLSMPITFEATGLDWFAKRESANSILNGLVAYYGRENLKEQSSESKVSRVNVAALMRQKREAHREKCEQKVSQYDLTGKKVAQYASLEDAVPG